MRVLLSTIGSRGDVQPLVALASQLKALGQKVAWWWAPVCRGGGEALGLPVTRSGPGLRTVQPPRPHAGAAPLSPEQRRQRAESSVATQFETIASAASG